MMRDGMGYFVLITGVLLRRYFPWLNSFRSLLSATNIFNVILFKTSSLAPAGYNIRSQLV
jgi:hypothetical protein